MHLELSHLRIERRYLFLNRQQNDYLVKIGPTILQLFRERYGDQVRRVLEGAEIVPGTELDDGDRGSLDLGGQQVEISLKSGCFRLFHSTLRGNRTLLLLPPVFWDHVNVLLAFKAT
jgi:hypothetical protein